eukprot:g2484.t1
MKVHFKLMEQFRTQDEPAYCGLGTLTMVLNALAVDPKRPWKGVWRWYSESMLDCCVPLEEVRKKGVTLEEFACLAVCNGLKRPRIVRPNSCDADDDDDVGEEVEEEDEDHEEVEKEDEDHEEVEKEDEDHGEVEKEDEDHAVCTDDKSCVASSRSSSASSSSSLRHFRNLVSAISKQDEKILVCSYSRKGLGQTGDGHFTTIGGYDESTDSCLILDVARFKYPPHWTKIGNLYDAMGKYIDKTTGRPRGWMILEKSKDPTVSCVSLLFSLVPNDDLARISRRAQDIKKRTVPKVTPKDIHVVVERYVAAISEIFPRLSDGMPLRRLHVPPEYRAATSTLVTQLESTSVYAATKKVLAWREEPGNADVLPRLDAPHFAAVLVFAMLSLDAFEASLGGPTTKSNTQLRNELRAIREQARNINSARMHRGCHSDGAACAERQTTV